MERIRGKLKSERGASILLALLLLLICMMVGASVLMAAASNAGKTRSNRDSHQAYLALSSALWLVIDDLTSEPYYGRYKFVETKDPDSGTVISTKYTQVEGIYKCRLEAELLKDMDSLFAEVMSRQEALNKTPGTTYDYSLFQGINTKHKLTVEPSDEEHFGDFKVEIGVTVGQKDDKGILTLEARLADAEGYENYLIQAELTAALPGWRSPNADNQDADNHQYYRSGEMRWADPKITRETAKEAGL